jgi:hypothetical protein
MVQSSKALHPLLEAAVGDDGAVLEGLVAEDVVSVDVGEEEVGDGFLGVVFDAGAEVGAGDGVLGVDGCHGVVHDDYADVSACLALAVGVDPF